MNSKTLGIDWVCSPKQKEISFITSDSKLEIRCVWNQEQRSEKEKACKTMEISSDCIRLANNLTSNTSKTYRFECMHQC